MQVTSSILDTVTADGGYVKLGASTVSSTTVVSGSITCAGVWSPGFTFFPSSCP